MHDICVPVLYGDCTPDNFVSFAAGLRTNENTDRTARLHIHHQRHWQEATYHEIFTLGWDALEDKVDINAVPYIRDKDSVYEECQALEKEGLRLRKFITEGLTILPNLRTVSMGGIGEAIYNGSFAPYIEQYYDCHFDDSRKLLPHSLIDLPTVSHYCQAVAFGPLALPSKILKLQSPLETFTHHPRPSPLFSLCRNVQATCSPPVILGAVNRYYCEAAISIPYSMVGKAEVDLTGLMDPILAMLSRSVYVADPTTGTTVISNDEATDIDGTVIELYAYVRAVDEKDLAALTRGYSAFSNKLQELAPQSLVDLQAHLDTLLPEEWKGKVWLKNREDAPPCPAYGLDLEEEFEDQKKPFSYESCRSGGRVY